MLGSKFGTHRVIEPKGVLPQPAQRLDNNMDVLWDNEILIDVQALNIDSASFTQIEQACGHDATRIGEMIQGIVAERGKQQNPVTGSGGMLIGTVEKIGPALEGRIGLAVGDRIASLVSLSLTPLRIDAITQIHLAIDRVEIRGKAILFESGIYVTLPTDMSDNLALAALDVAGAPAQAKKLVKDGDRVLILGAHGKSGMLCAWEAMKHCRDSGRVVGVVRRPEQREQLIALGLVHDCVVASATDPVAVLEASLGLNDGREYDLSINCVNVENTEMASILPVRDGGIVYFFSMATSFTQAALGAEGVGKDVTMIIGNGYTKDHADITLQIMRESDALRAEFEKLYL